MLHTIVEGDPGIFPDPVARVMRKIGGWFVDHVPEWWTVLVTIWPRLPGATHAKALPRRGAAPYL